MQDKINKIFDSKSFTTILNNIFSLVLNTLLTIGAGPVGWIINGVISGL